MRKLSEMFKSKRRRTLQLLCESLFEILIILGEYSAVLAIPNARIPIVKFRHNDR